MVELVEQFVIIEKVPGWSFFFGFQKIDMTMDSKLNVEKALMEDTRSGFQRYKTEFLVATSGNLSIFAFYLFVNCADT